MGSEENSYLDHIERIKDRGDKFWWLHLSCCKKCNQYWLIAQEERHNDVYCLKRLTQSQGSEILSKNEWPKCFDSYGRLLKIGKDYGHRVEFVDPLNSSLVFTVIDLAKEHPNIGISELCKLLNVDKELAIALSEKALKTEKIEIDFKK